MRQQLKEALKNNQKMSIPVGEGLILPATCRTQNFTLKIKCFCINVILMKNCHQVLGSLKSKLTPLELVFQTAGAINLPPPKKKIIWLSA